MKHNYWEGFISVLSLHLAFLKRNVFIVLVMNTKNDGKSLKYKKTKKKKLFQKGKSMGIIDRKEKELIANKESIYF